MVARAPRRGLRGGGARTLTLEAPAKLNLTLSVLGRRPDGYHEVETVMQCVDLADTVRLRFAPGPRTSVRLALRGGPASRGIPRGGGNLCVRAGRAYLERAGLSGALRIALTKRIPAGAGMGGGSSDAAAVLLGLERISGGRLGRRGLSALAGGIGSDVPFFLSGPLALCRGRGERVRPFRSARRLHFVAVHPGISLSTARVYRALKPAERRLQPRGRAASLTRAALLQGNLMNLAQHLSNALEPPARRLCPRLKSLQATMHRLPFLAVSMTGSGSAYFGLVRSSREASQMARRLLRIDPSIGRVYPLRALRAHRSFRNRVDPHRASGGPPGPRGRGEHHRRPGQEA